MFKKVELWWVLLILILGAGSLILFGAAVKHKMSGGQKLGKLGDIVLELSSVPVNAKKIFSTPPSKEWEKASYIQPQIRNYTEFSNLKVNDPSQRLEGLLLVPGYNPEYGVTTVFLYDLGAKKKLHEWIPPIQDIFKATSFHEGSNLQENYRTQHPLLLDNGSLIFHSGEGPLARIDMCGNLTWVIDQHFHHSIEQAKNGNLFVPIAFGTSSDPSEIETEGHFVNPLREDGIAEITPDGKIVRTISIMDILENQEYVGLMYGVGEYEVDRFHLNDIQPVNTADDFVQEGDLILSIRNLSTVMLYRPSSNKIVWLKTGPWLNQHDADYQGNGIFTIYGNDFVRGKDMPRKVSNIWMYDQKQDESRILFELNDKGSTETGGLHEVLENGDIFVEGSRSSTLIMYGKNGAKWEFVNSIEDGKVGAIHWSRYLDKNKVNLNWLSDVNCKS